MSDYKKRNLICLIAFVLAIIISISMSLLSKSNTLKASDEENWYSTEEQIEEEIITEPIEENSEDRIIIYLEDMPILEDFPVEESESIVEENNIEEDRPLDIYIYYYFTDEINYGMNISILSEISETTEPLEYEWRYSLDGEEWFLIDGAIDPTYSFILDEENVHYKWKLTVNRKEDENLQIQEDFNIINPELIEESEIVEQ